MMNITIFIIIVIAVMSAFMVSLFMAVSMDFSDENTSMNEVMFVCYHSNVNKYYLLFAALIVTIIIVFIISILLGIIFVNGSSILVIFIICYI